MKNKKNHKEDGRGTVTAQKREWWERCKGD
jgi:hypothetical protein